MNLALGILTVKGKRQKSKSTLHTEDLIDDSVLGSNPADPGEVTQSRENEIREPVPTERSTEGKEEETVTRHLANLDFLLRRVQSSIESSVPKNSRPNKAFGLDNQGAS